MKSKLLLFVLAICLLCGVSAAFAGSEEVTVTKLTRYTYIEDTIGFYKLCGDTTWTCMIINNESDTSTHTVTFPTKASVAHPENGTRHNVSGYSYKKLDYKNLDENGYSKFYLTTDIPETTAFSGTLELDKHSTYAVFFTVESIGQYTPYWDTGIFFDIKVDNTDVRSISGQIAQRGKSCSDDKTVSMDIVSAGYDGSGENGEITVTVKNTYPMKVDLSLSPKLEYSGTNGSGESVSGTLPNSIRWDTDKKTLNPGAQATISGTFKLPSAVASGTSSLELTLFSSFPSSLFFGNVQQTSFVRRLDGAYATFTGTFSADGTRSSITGTINNSLSKSISITLPSTGMIRVGSETKSVPLTWNQSSPLTVASNGKANISGKISFSNAERSLLAANNSLEFVTEFNYSENQKALFAGSSVLTREKETGAKIVSNGICRDYDPASNTITLTYGLKNPSNIDIPVQLAKTIAVTDVVHNPTVKYTGCVSGGTSCTSRISEDKMITIRSGETITLTGTAKPETAPKTSAVISTSLVCFPNEEEQILFVGSTSDSCSTEDDGTIESVSFCRDYTAATNTLTFKYTLKNPSAKSIPVELATTLYVPDITAYQPITYTRCESGDAKTDCGNRISNGWITMDAGETIAFSGTVKPTAAPATGAVISTSLRYSNKLLPLYVGRATQSCGMAPEQPDEPEPPAAILSYRAQSGRYANCTTDKNVTFGWTVTNTGNLAGSVPLSDLTYSLNGTTVPVTYTSCIRQSSAGADPTCSISGQSAVLSVEPGVSLTVNAVYEPAAKIETSGITLKAKGTNTLTGLEFDISANKTGTCAANVNIEADADGNPIQAIFDTGDPTKVTVQVLITNSGSEDAQIKPSSLSFHGTTLTNYQNASGKYTGGTTEFPIAYDQAFDLPAHSSAVLSIPLTIDPKSVSGKTENVNWVFKFENAVLNANGKITFPTVEPGPTPTTEPTTEPTARPTVRPTTEPDPVPGRTINFIILDDDELLNRLPSTGFSAVHPTALSVQPSDLAYHMLDGLRIEIPTLSVGADILSVPLVDGLWSVDWLGESAAIPEAGILPGEGTSVIAAHNHIDDMSAGPFLFIRYLQNNDRIFVTDDNGKFLSFSVYLNETVEPNEGALIYEHAIPGSLVLVTCEDELPEGGYAYRRLVYAQPLQ